MYRFVQLWINAGLMLKKIVFPIHTSTVSSVLVILSVRFRGQWLLAVAVSWTLSVWCAADVLSLLQTPSTSSLYWTDWHSSTPAFTPSSPLQTVRTHPRPLIACFSLSFRYALMYVDKNSDCIKARYTKLYLFCSVSRTAFKIFSNVNERTWTSLIHAHLVDSFSLSIHLAPSLLYAYHSRGHKLGCMLVRTSMDTSDDAGCITRTVELHGHFIHD